MARITKIWKAIFSINFFLLIAAMIVVSSAKISLSSIGSLNNVDKIKFFAPVIEKLLARGADTGFVYSIISDKSTRFDEKFVKINVTGYLKKADYSKMYSDLSVSKSVGFLRDNYDVLSLCELKYGVPKEVIASILWIETRLGNFLGSSHIPTVFLSTAMADNAEFVELNKKELYKLEKDSLRIIKLDKEIERRAAKKAAWAITELMYLEKLNEISPIPINDLRGSWAGAFGMSQFLPSSYVKWAVDGNGDGVINLFETEDAIFSVGNYLKANGWGSSDSAKRAAVFHYNNSKDYVRAVLLLADKIRDSI